MAEIINKSLIIANSDLINNKQVFNNSDLKNNKHLFNNSDLRNNKQVFNTSDLRKKCVWGHTIKNNRKNNLQIINIFNVWTIFGQIN